MAFFNAGKRQMFVCLLLLFALSGCRSSEIVYVSREDQTREDALSGDAERQDSTAAQDSAAGQPSSQEAEETEPETISVFVCGAVNAPGVYEFPEHSRANAAVEAAGGFREDADTQWCNLAQPLSDGQKLRIYTMEETMQLQQEGAQEEGAPRTEDRAEESDGRINLNTATKEQLMSLPGIGNARAEAILSWREMHGSFTSPEQIREISGFKDAIYNSIRDFIYTG